jgi:cytochrome c553
MKTLSLILATAAVAVTLSADVNLGACVGCHGSNWEKVALGKSKVVKDMNVTEIETALLGYKDGTYGGTLAGVMKGQVAKYDATQIKEIAKLIKK